MPINTKEIAKKIFESGILDEPEQYTIQDLFRIRDALEMLANYRLADMDLLQEVHKYITQKTER